MQLFNQLKFANNCTFLWCKRGIIHFGAIVEYKGIVFVYNDPLSYFIP